MSFLGESLDQKLSLELLVQATVREASIGINSMFTPHLMPQVDGVHLFPEGERVLGSD